ncbi:hypothetical protein M4I33_00440 [Clostridium sp. LY3-2]|uniref:hypothetical protein n=1 Tax=Clostridium sp. LY3-2 TaxID=2942482 RepID=UPI0021521D7D|nr:hypothetical protein [Clostridium sp. LY3-2]MCR6513347.1 hypothetical protein [Clostridium sp. LY3-2]
MKLDNDEKIIFEALNSIKIKDNNLKYNVHNKLNKKKPLFFPKRIAFAIVILLSFTISIPVLANSSSSFNNLINFVEDKFLSLFNPLEIKKEDNNIKLEVVSGVKDNDTAIIYITLQDLNGNRIDENLDLNDSLKIKGLDSFTSELSYFDKETQTATLKIQGTGNSLSDNLSLSLSSFLSGKVEESSVLDKNTFLELIKTKPSTVKLNPKEMLGTSGDIGNFESIDVLNKGTLNHKFKDIPNMTITNIGIINNSLHIQTKWNKEKHNNHGYLYLTNNKDETLKLNSSNISLSFNEYGDAIQGNDYVEFIYDLEEFDPTKLNLNAYSSYNENLIEGNWNLKFKLEPLTFKKEISPNLNTDLGLIKDIKISPIGIFILTESKFSNLDSIKLEMIDGSIITLTKKVVKEDSNTTYHKFFSSSPLDENNIKHIFIHNQKFNIN